MNHILSCPWDFRDKSNQELKENVFLFTALVLMKAALKNDTETIREIFHFWHDKGLMENKEMVLFFLGYIYHTRKINREQLKKMPDESKIDGGEFMPTIYQQIRNEVKNEFEKEKEEIAKRLIMKGMDVDTISEQLASIVH
jgi:hypothetical protein